MVDTSREADRVSTMDQAKRKKRERRAFTDEFKAGAVGLVLDQGKTIARVARDLDLSASALGGWVERARADRSHGKTGLTTAEREEMARLRKENRELRMERDLLKNHPRGAHTCRTKNSRRGIEGAAREERPQAFWRRPRSRKKTWSRDCSGLESGDALGRSRLGN